VGDRRLTEVEGKHVISQKWLSAAAAGVLTLSLVACGDDNGNPGDGRSGSIVIDGSSTVAPYSEAAAELFMGANGGVQVSVGTSGTGGGFEKFCNGETDISDASRAISDDEIAACEANGVEWQEVAVANDALSVLVHPDNPVDCLTVDQLNAIWAPGSTISRWSDIPELGVDFDEPLDLYGPGTTSGTFDYFTEAINGEEGVQRTDYNDIGEDDNSGLVGVTGTVGGMFYVGFTYYTENQSQVKALQIDGGGGCVAPSAEAVQDGSYAPLGRQLYIYPSAAALGKPEVLAFITFYIEQNEAVTEPVGGIPLTPDQRAEAIAKVDSLAGR
jgi:phosphate transport system substrate-binding protein